MTQTLRTSRKVISQSYKDGGGVVLSDTNDNFSVFTADSLQESDFIFLSPHKSLVARDCIATLSRPAQYAHHLTGEFQQEVKDLLYQATLQGIKNPIIAGAIPFDKQQPCSLFIPKYYQWVDREILSRRFVPGRVAGKITFHPDHDVYCHMVNKVIDKIHNGVLDKAVLARFLTINTDDTLNALYLWHQLNQQNSTSYNFHIPFHDGVLIGASPELLLRKQNETIISCPLAGSASRAKNSNTDDQSKQKLLSSIKDFHEHKVVTNTILQRLQERCQLSVTPEPTLLSTPELWHLATPIKGRITDFRDNALSLACLLHPTPALCGVPYACAKKIINQLEPVRRNWFGGIVGWSDAEGNGEWVVTIRCGMIYRHKIMLFAGAGIVAGSRAESEWCETEAKFNTMLHAVGVSP